MTMEFLLAMLVMGLFLAGVWIYDQAKEQSNRERREALMEKYGDPELVEAIEKSMFWQGQTAEQLLESLGKPAAVDEKVMKTKTKRVWKYDQIASNRYALKITLDDGTVVGWDQKG